MKALSVNGSPRPKGCTFTALSELAKTLEENGIETEIIQIGNKDIRGCIACRKCHSTGSGKCIFDDIVNKVAPKFAEADAFVIGSPVYFASPAGGAVAFLDRLFFSTLNVDKTMKVGAAVVSCRRGGNTATFDMLNKYFTMTGMPVVSSQYWNMVYGGSPEEVLQDEEGLQTMRTLGRNMAFLMKSIQLGKQQMGLPEKEQQVFTNFHR
ncbi:flavodoxin family protein [Catenibacterium mitsuokai]|uniref:flavodoxin family protein n=1 Tax=Catenibacterium mitsuokai TaxID=100886 RepID=UPI002E7A7273|nr:flavodoxin family protein [Catenibacterium mitsuokai]